MIALFDSMNVNDAAPAIEGLVDCPAAVWSWFLWNDLQLWDNKSEDVIPGRAPQFQSAATIQVVEEVTVRAAGCT